MKKILCVWMSVCLITAFAALFTVHAEEDPPSASMEDALILHWDFEGDTLEEQLRNKAENGSVNDSLSLETAGNLSSVSDGVAHITSDTTEYLHFNVDTENGIGQKLVDTANEEMTFYIRFAVDGAAENTATPFCFNHLKSQAFKTRGYVATTGGFTGRFNNDTSTNTNVPDNVLFDGEYNTVVITYKHNADDSLNITVYLSFWNWEDPSDIANKKTCNIAVYEGNLWQDESDILFGKMYNQISTGSTPTDLKKDFYYDDIRIYNRVLSEDEIQTLKAESNPGSGEDDPVTTTGSDSESDTQGTPSTPAQSDETQVPSADSGTATGDTEKDTNENPESGCASVLSSRNTVFLLGLIGIGAFATLGRTKQKEV